MRKRRPGLTRTTRITETSRDSILMATLNPVSRFPEAHRSLVGASSKVEAPAPFLVRRNALSELSADSRRFERSCIGSSLTALRM